MGSGEVFSIEEYSEMEDHDEEVEVVDEWPDDDDYVGDSCGIDFTLPHNGILRQGLLPTIDPPPPAVNALGTFEALDTVHRTCLFRTVQEKSIRKAAFMETTEQTYIFRALYRVWSTDGGEAIWIALRLMSGSRWTPTTTHSAAPTMVTCSR